MAISKDLLDKVISGDLDPITGIQGESKTQSTTGSSAIDSGYLDAVIKNPTPHHSVGRGDLGLDWTEYQDYGGVPTNIKDLTDYRADNQSIGEQLAFGAGRLLSTTATKFLAGIGYTASIPAAIASGDLNVMLDNAFSESINDAEESLKEAMPIHHRRKYLEGNVFNQMGTLGFWMDDVVDGVAFMASAAVGAKGLDKVGAGVKGYSKLAQLASKATRAARTGKIVDGVTPDLANWAKFADYTTINAFNSVTEAAFEAKGIKDSILDNLSNKVVLGEITKEEANLRASDAAKNTFVWNIAALMPSNAVTNSMLFKKFDYFKYAGGGLGAVGKGVKPLTLGQQAGIFAGNALMSAASEGVYEENLQTAVQQYYEDIATGFKNPTVGEDITGVAKNWVNNFTTDEGQKSIMLGAIIGLLPGGASGLQSAKAENQKLVALQSAFAGFLENNKNKVQDFYRTTDSLVTPGQKTIMLKDGKPIVDTDKIRATFSEYYKSHVDLVASLKASNSGNRVMFDFIKNHRLAGVAAGFSGLEGGLDTFNEWVDTYAAEEVEGLKKAGYEPDGDFLEDTKQDYKKKAAQYFKYLDQIDNNYAGLMSLPNTEAGNNFRTILKAEQFTESVNQLFWTDELAKHKKEINKAKAAEETELVESLTKRKTEIESLLKESNSKIVELLDTKIQTKRFETMQAEIKEASEQKGAVDKDIAESPSNSDVTDNTSETVQVSPDKSVTIPGHVILSNDKTSTKATSISPEQAAANNYETDLGRSSEESKVYYKKDEANGTLHTIITDSNGEIVRDTYTEQRSLYNSVGVKQDVAVNFVNGRLKSISSKDTVSNTVKEISIATGSVKEIKDINNVFEQVMETQGLQLSPESEAAKTSTEYVNTREELINQMRDESGNVKPEMQEYVKAEAARIRKELVESLAKPEMLRNLYGDVRYDSTTLQQLFADNSIKYVPVIYAGKAGIIENVKGQLIFKEVTSEGEIGSSYILGGQENTNTLSELDVVVLKQLPFDFEFVGDSRTYNIQGVYYNNLFETVTDAIEYDVDGNVISITLWDSNNKKIKFTSPFLISNLAYAIELLETVEDTVFNDYLKGKDDFVIFNTGELDYAVYKKANGKYSIVNVLTQRPITGKLYTTVKTAFLTELNKSITEIAKSKINEFTSTKKQIKDEIRRIANNIRPATAVEANVLPDASETKDPEGAKETKGTTETESEVEKQLEEKVVEKAAVAEVAEQLRDKQKEEADKVLDSTVDTVEVLDVTEVPTGELVAPDYGIRQSATAVSYVWYDRQTGKYVVNNQDFHVDLINSNEKDIYLTPEIDYDNVTFWKGNENLKAELQKGSLSEERINKILEVTSKDFTNPVDALPIKLSIELNGKESSEGTYMHTTAYDKIAATETIKNIKDPAERQKAYEVHVREQQMLTRGVRRDVLTRLLTGKPISFVAANKTMGAPNNIGKNQNLGEVLLRADKSIDLRTVSLGVGVRPGAIYKNKEEVLVTPGTVSKGNVVLETNLTANGRLGIIKLNPAKLSVEHAGIVLKAFRQAFEKGKGGFAGKYEGAEVTGDLTRLEVLNTLIYYGEENTKINPKDFRRKGHLMSKQLWVENARTLHFGDQAISLHTTDKAEIDKFINWATSNKNYTLNKSILGSAIPNKNAFSIGSFKYDPAVDNYTSFVIKNGIVLTDVDVVEGTSSLFKHPVLGIDLSSGGIDSTVPKLAEQTIIDYRGQRQEPLTKPAKEVKEEPVVAKEEIKVVPSPAMELQPLNSIAGIQVLPEGSYVYVPINEDGKITKFSIGVIVKGKSGKLGISLRLNLNSPYLGGIKKKFTGLTSFAFDDISSLNSFKQAVKGDEGNIYFDSPEVKLVVEPQVETSKEVTDFQVETFEQLPIEDQLDVNTASPDNIGIPGLEDTGDVSLDDVGFNPFRETTWAKEGFKPSDTKAEIKALNKRLRANRAGQIIPVDIMDRLIKIGANRHAFAQFTVDGFKLSRLAEEGSLLHEVFHRVSLAYLTTAERNSIYKEARIKHPNATDTQIEELLAEGYREYALLKEENPTVEPKVSFGQKVKSFFKNLYDFLFTWFTGKTKLDSYDIATLYSAIDKGRYKYARISKENLSKLGGKVVNFEVKEVKLDSIQSSEEWREVVQNLFYLLAESNGLISSDKATGSVSIRLSNLEDVKVIEFGALYSNVDVLRKRYNSIAVATNNAANELRKGVTAERLAEINTKFFKGAKLTKEAALTSLSETATTAARIAEVFNEVYTKFDVFKLGVEDFMESINISKVKDSSDLDLTDIDEDNGGSPLSEIERHNKSSYELSSKESTMLSIKLLLSMLPETTQRSKLTGLFKFAPFSNMWTSISNDLSGSQNMEEMMTRLTRLSTDNIPYQALVKKLKADENLKTQFYRTMQKHKHSFINLLASLNEDTKTLSYRMINAAVQQAATKYAKEWGGSLVKNRNLFKITKGQNTEGNTELFNSLIERFDTLVIDSRKQANRGDITDLNDKIEELVNLLNTVNIPVDNKTIRVAMVNLNKETESQAFVDLILNKIPYIFHENSTINKVLNNQSVLDSQGKKTSPDKVYTYEKGVLYLADEYAKTRPFEIGDSIYGPGGNRYYTIAQNTYISDVLRSLKNDKDSFIAQRSSSLYNKNSRFLKELVENPALAERIKLLTMSSFSREDSYDTGREYQGITDLEDTLMRITAIENGKLTPPTPADRGFYYFYEGFKTLDVTLDQFGKVSGDIIDVFYGYYQDEVARINKVREEVDKVINGELSSTELFETYHYAKYLGRTVSGEGIVDGKQLKKDGRYTGRGANFTHFAGYTIEMTEEQVKEKLQETLAARILDTKNELNRLGITSDGRNLLLDEAVVDKYIKLTGSAPAAMNSLIANFAINTMYSNIETGKMFTGDPSAFKSSEDYVKRLPGYTSTGDNLRTDFPADYYAGERLIQGETYNITTFTSHVIASDMYADLVTLHTDYYLKKGMAKTKAEAEKIAENKLGGLLRVDQTDAQTFLTPEMYRAISIRLGEWTDKKEAAYKILQSDKEFTNRELVQLSDVVMQPLKMTYMNIVYRNGHAIPVFDKMSMSTLFRPFVKNKQIVELLDRMESKGKYAGQTPVDQVKFHTAEKVGIKDRRELFSDNTETAFTDLTKLSIYPQQFSNLRYQLVTDPHDIEKMPIGSQFKKVGMSNIYNEDIYKIGAEEIFGIDLRKHINELLSELSNRGKAKLFSELKIDSTTVKFTDTALLVGKLKAEAKKAGLPDYIVEGFKVDETGKMYVSVDAFPGNRKWIQSRIISLIKKATIDLKLPGNVFVQMSDIGLRKIDRSDELKFADEEGYIQAIVSISLFKTLIPDYDKKSHNKRVEYLSQHPELVSLGYRVPTQGQNSIYMLKIVDFLPESVGDIIVLPKEGPGIGGFDFDIDKLYAIRHNYKDGQKVKYDNTKSMQENSTEAVENRLIDSYIATLSNENHVIRRTTPLGYTAEIMKDLAKVVRKWKGITEDVKEALTMTAPKYQLDVKSRYKFGGKGLGPFALANVHHILGQGVELGMQKYIGLGHQNTEGTTDLSQILGEDGVDITEWFSGLIDAHVDIAADPYVYYLNVNDLTRDVVTLLIRAGVGGVRTLMFSSQQILTEVAELQANKDNELGVEIKDVIGRIKKRYSNLMLKRASKEFVPESFDASNLNKILAKGYLEQNLSNKNRDAQYYNNQLLILEAFEYLNQFAEYLKEATMASRVDTKKFGISNSEVIGYKNRVIKAYNDMNSGVGVKNFDRLMEETYLGALSENSIDVIPQVLGDIVLEGTPAFTNLVSKVLKLTGNFYSLDAKTIPNLAEEIYTNIYGEFFKNTGLNETKAKSLIYGDNSIPKLIHDIRAGSKFPNLANNKLIRMLEPSYKEGAPDYLAASKPDNKWYRDDIVRDWLEIFRGTAEERQLAIDLFQYSYLNSGFKGSVYAFHDLAPLELVKYTGLDTFVKQKLVEFVQNPIALDRIFDNLFQNSVYNKTLIPFIKTIDYLTETKNKAGDTIAFSTDMSYLYRGKNAEGQYVYAPFIKVGKNSSTIYKFIGTHGTTKKAVYAYIPSKGYSKEGITIRENAFDTSIFASNTKTISADILANLTPTGFYTMIENYKNIANRYVGYEAVEDLNVVDLAEDLANAYSSQSIMEANSIAKLHVSDSVLDALDNGEREVTILELGDDLTGWWTLPDGRIVELTRIEQDKYSALDFGWAVPSQEEIDKRKKECK